MVAKGNKVKRTYTLRGALAKRLKARRPDGTRPWDDALTAFVQKLCEGDPRAIELAMSAVDGPQATLKRHEHSVSRDLLIRPDGDKRGRVVDASASAVPALPEAHDIASTPDKRCPDALDSSQATGTTSEGEAPNAGEQGAPGEQ
jgi:hypothetical protein